MYWKNGIFKDLYGEIIGITTPQIYIKVRNNFTPFHFENLNLISINVNFGPGASVWGFIPSHQIGKLKKAY